MANLPMFSAQDLTAISKILGNTEKGLTGGDIEYLLQDCRIPDVNPDITKWKRLFNAFVGLQNTRQFGNHVIVFINRAMNPVQYTEKPHLFAERKDNLNAILSLSGYMVSDSGKVVEVPKANNLDEALARANRLHAALHSRQVHSDVLAFCKAEFLQENFFHAVFEAMKSVADKIRKLSGMDADGSKLVDMAFGFKEDTKPILALNSLETETQRGEQRGFSNLLKGLFGTVRNPLAHEAKIEWDMPEQDALDILTTLSLIHRKLDKAHKAA